MIIFAVDETDKSGCIALKCAEQDEEDKQWKKRL